MARVHEVGLPINLRAVFPDRCPGCCRPSIGEPVWFAASGATRPGLLLQGIGLVNGVSVLVPICPACHETWRAHRSRHAILALASAILVLAFLALFLVGMRFAMSRTVARIGGILVLAAIGAGFLPRAAARYRLPPPFGAYATPHRIVYAFRDREYAAEFRRLNP